VVISNYRTDGYKNSFETLVANYSSTRRLVPEYFNVYQQSCKNLKSKKPSLNGRVAADKDMTHGKSDAAMALTY
jgi:hypothetical protein